MSVMHRLGLGVSGWKDRTGSGLPGAEELQAMCRNARRVHELCELLEVEHGGIFGKLLEVEHGGIFGKLLEVEHGGIFGRSSSNPGLIESDDDPYHWDT